MMKKQMFTWMFLIAVQLIVFGQTNKYPTKSVNNTECYQYTVQQGEGLYGVARKFNTTVAELVKYNPEIEMNGLKMGQQLSIPVSKVDTKPQPEVKPTSSTSSVQAISNPQFILHKVEKQQTIFAISKLYKVNQEDIRKSNPQIANGLTEGMILQIPKPQATNATNSIKQEQRKEPSKVEKTPSLTSNDAPRFFLYRVQSKETLFSLCKRFEVSMGEMLRLNPNAIILNAGSDLKVPINDKNIKYSQISPAKVDSVMMADIKKNTVIQPVTPKFIKMAFILPFMLNSEKKDPSMDRFVEFYSGALIAIQDAKLRGVNVEVFTFDTGNSEESINLLLKNEQLKSVDLIIGPAFSSHIPFVSEFAKKNKIHTLIPFSSKVHEISTNPFIFQFNPGADADLIMQQAKNMRIIFAEIPGVSDLDGGKVWAEELKKLLTSKNTSFSKIELTTANYTNYSSVLKKGEKNLIIFNTDKYSSITPFLSPLRLRADEYDIVFFEHYAWRGQDTKMPQSMYISPFMTKPDVLALEAFNAKYKSFFSHDGHKRIPRYDLLGYDLSNYFIRLIDTNGDKFSTEIVNFKDNSGIQSQPHFERESSGGGFINRQLYLGEDKLQ